MYHFAAGMGLPALPGSAFEQAPWSASDPTRLERQTPSRRPARIAGQLVVGAVPRYPMLHCMVLGERGLAGVTAALLVEDAVQSGGM